MLLVVNAPFDEDGVANPDPDPDPPPPALREGFAAFDLTFGSRSEIIGPDADGGALPTGGTGE
jgi:hypothetical protein